MNFTINSAIETIREAIANKDVDAAREAAAFLDGKSRFTADQKTAIEEVFDSYHELVGEDEEDPKSMAAKLRRAREHYEISVSASGNKSFYNGDDVAVMLEGKSADEVMALADEFTPLDKGTHAKRYARLNLGSRRMNAGNKLRAAVARGDLGITYNDGNVPVGLFVNPTKDEV